jgi:hypothetical protein
VIVPAKLAPTADTEVTWPMPTTTPPSTSSLAILRTVLLLARIEPEAVYTADAIVKAHLAGAAISTRMLL